MTVTRCEGESIYELAGRPALERLVELLERLGPDERALAQRGIHLGRVIDEHKVDFERGDFLIRTVLGGDRDVGAIAVGDEVEVGSTVQFQVRDAESADEDLRELLAGRRATGALVFTCNGRGTHLFGAPTTMPRSSMRRGRRRHRRDVLRRRDRPHRRSQLPARLHRVGPAVPD